MRRWFIYLFAVTPAIAFFLQGSQRDTVILSLELLSEAGAVLAVCFLFRNTGRRKWLLAISLLMLLVAELPYGLNHITGRELLAIFDTISELFYTGFICFLALFLVRGYSLRAEKLRSDIPIFAILATIFFFLSFKYVLSPFYFRQETPILLHVVNSTFYRIVEAACFSLALILSGRVTEKGEQVFLHSIVLMCISSFALGYNDGVLHGEGYPLHEYGWLFGAVGLFVALLLKKDVSGFWATNRSRWTSVRAKLVFAIFLTNSILLLLLHGIKFYQIGNAFQLTTVMFGLFLVWVISNAIAISFSGKVLSAVKTVTDAKVFGFEVSRLPHFTKIDRKVDLYEFDSMIDGYNGLVVKNNELLERTFSQELEKSKLEALTKLSHQVAHDIRSPLSALQAVASDLSQFPEDERVMMRAAINRIKDIANNLIEKNRELKNAAPTATEPLSIQLLSSLVDPLISEKRQQYRSMSGIEIDARLDSAYGLFANVQVTEFKRVLSNLINNSVEAMGDKGTVTVRLCDNADNIELVVEDNGKGIDPAIIPRLGTRGMSHEKPGGSGLGLYHAKASVRSWGGTLDFQSQLGKGTSVTLRFPKVNPPSWFVSELKVSPGTLIVIVDDDPSVHSVWQKRFDALDAKVELLHFSTPDEISDWVRKNATTPALFLMDQELIGFTLRGTDLIRQLGIAKQSVLVTSRFEETEVLDECKRLGVPMIPKGLAGFVPIRLL